MNKLTELLAERDAKKRTLAELEPQLRCRISVGEWIATQGGVTILSAKVPWGDMRKLAKWVLDLIEPIPCPFCDGNHEGQDYCPVGKDPAEKAPEYKSIPAQLKAWEMQVAGLEHRIDRALQQVRWWICRDGVGSPVPTLQTLEIIRVILDGSDEIEEEAK